MTVSANSSIFTQRHKADIDSDVHCVFLHGWSMNSHAWTPILPGLKNIHRHTVDLCGHGRSDAVNLAEDTDGHLILNAWLDALEPHLPSSPFYLCGWSLGGIVALAMHQRWPERVRGLSLIGTSPCFVAQENWPALPKQNLIEFSHRFTHNPIATLREFIALQLSGTHNNKGDTLKLLKSVRAHGKANALGLQHGLRILMDVNLKSHYTSINSPCQILLGENDDLIPNELHQPFAKLNPSISQTIWADAGHSPLFSHPDKTTNWLKAFMQP